MHEQPGTREGWGMGCPLGHWFSAPAAQRLSPGSFSKPNCLAAPPGDSELMSMGWGQHVFGFKVPSVVRMCSQGCEPLLHPSQEGNLRAPVTESTKRCGNKKVLIFMQEKKVGYKRIR